MGLSSSTLSTTPNTKYDVFLSFRGEDTRRTITSHLYKALTQKNIETFIDDSELKKGDEISSSLVEAIENSNISVVIFSRDYASSNWCLNELVKILDCKKMYGQMVIPVFYHVDPSHVRKQLGTYKDAFVRHEKDFKKMPEKVQSWRSALTEASNLAGWDLSTIRSEADLVDKVVKDVLKKLNISCLSYCKGLVGLDSRINKIKSLLFSGLSDFQVVGIWGMGGVGKTTLVGVVFNQFYSEFEGYHFCNVREKSERFGLYHLRDEIVSQILGEENLKIGTPTIPTKILQRLQRKKVLIVLDDVNTLEELEFLAGGVDRFGLGSKIIITARDRNILHSYGVQNVYKVEKFNDDEALQLFCNYAFKQNYPPVDLVMLSKRILVYAEGNPLAIKLLGSSLYEKSKQDWESAMCNLKMIVSPHIFDVLKISYERLSGQEKNIFLDISCFFRGEHMHLVTKILDGCYNQSTRFCLTTLAEKSLITISKHGKIKMHNLLQEMGQDIVHQESEKRPGQRSRLWYHEDIYRILHHNEGTDSIEGMFLDMSKIEEIQLSSQAFTKMPHLRLLKFFNYMHHKDNVDISKVHLPWGLEYLPDELRYLHWDGYPLKALPLKFSSENLVELNLHNSKVKQLWEGKMNLPNLESLVLSNSQYLTSIPNLSNAVKLKELILYHCTRLKSLPSSICKLKSLKKLDLSHCSNLESFPEILEEMKSLRELILNGATKLKELPSSIENLSGLQVLRLKNCRNVKINPSSICNLTSLYFFDASGCSKLANFIENLGNMNSLMFFLASRINGGRLPHSLAHWKRIVLLQLEGNSFESLPASIKQLSQLLTLRLSSCDMLQSLPELPLSLKVLEASDCKQLRSLPKLPSNLEEEETSTLEIMSSCRGRSTSKNITFVFANCHKLDKNASNIWANANLRFQHMANGCTSYEEKVYENYTSLDRNPHVINFCLPGSEILDWINYKSLGSSLNSGLPQHWYNERFIGFALCVVVASEENFTLQRFDGYCDYSFKTKDGDKVDFSCNFTADYSFLFHSWINSDHVLLAYDPCFDVRLLKGHYTIASFEFNCGQRGYSNEYPKVKKCGVCPLYAKSNNIQSNRPQPNISVVKLVNQAFGETIDHVDASGSGSERSDEEEGEELLDFGRFFI